jgi:hypothetical protein
LFRNPPFAVRLCRHAELGTKSLGTKFLVSASAVAVLKDKGNPERDHEKLCFQCDEMRKWIPVFAPAFAGMAKKSFLNNFRLEIIWFTLKNQ